MAEWGDVRLGRARALPLHAEDAAVRKLEDDILAELGGSQPEAEGTSSETAA
jgi:hypothetical protein